MAQRRAKSSPKDGKKDCKKWVAPGIEPGSRSILLIMNSLASSMYTLRTHATTIPSNQFIGNRDGSYNITSDEVIRKNILAPTRSRRGKKGNGAGKVAGSLLRFEENHKGDNSFHFPRDVHS